MKAEVSIANYISSVILKRWEKEREGDPEDTRQRVISLPITSNSQRGSQKWVPSDTLQFHHNTLHSGSCFADFQGAELL